MSVELGFWIPIIVGFQIPWAVFRIPQTTFFPEPDFNSKMFLDLRIQTLFEFKLETVILQI